VPSVASWVRLDPSAAVAPAPPPPLAPAPATVAPTPVPAPAPPGTRVAAKLSVTVKKPTMRLAGTGVHVTLRLRANRRANVRITLIRPPHGRAKASVAIGARRITLRANTATRWTLTVPRALLGSLRNLRVSVVARDAAGGRLIINRVAELPARR
jgi:hypothetical protein